MCSWHDLCLNTCCSQIALMHFAVRDLLLFGRGLNAPFVICLQSLFDVFEAEEELAAEGSVAELDEDMLFGDVLEGEEIEDDEEIFNLNSGWSVNAFEGAGDSLGTGFDADDLDDLDEDDDELGMAASELLRSVPSHVVKRLEVEQVEADKFNKEHKLRRAGGGGGTKPKTQRRLRIIGGTASGIRIHSQVMKEPQCRGDFSAIAEAQPFKRALPFSRHIWRFSLRSSVLLAVLSSDRLIYGFLDALLLTQPGCRGG